MIKNLLILFLFLPSSLFAKEVSLGYGTKQGDFNSIFNKSITSQSFFIKYKGFNFKGFDLGGGFSFEEINKNVNFKEISLDSRYTKNFNDFSLFIEPSLLFFTYEEKSSIHKITSLGSGYKVSLGVSKNYKNFIGSIFYSIEEKKIDELMFSSAQDSFFFQGLNLSVGYNF